MASSFEPVPPPSESRWEQHPPKVVWDEKEGKFETEDKEAFLQYKLLTLPEKPQRIKGTDDPIPKPVVVMDMLHTYVPRSKRGRGVAALLCAAAFEHAADRSLPVVPSCTYISDTFLPKNPRWSWLVYGSKELKASSM